MIIQCCPPFGNWFVLVDVWADVCAHINVGTGEVDCDHAALWL